MKAANASLALAGCEVSDAEQQEQTGRQEREGFAFGDGANGEVGGVVDRENAATEVDGCKFTDRGIACVG